MQGLLHADMIPCPEGDLEHALAELHRHGVRRIDWEHLVNHSFDQLRALTQEARLAEFVKLLDGPAFRLGLTYSLHNRHGTLPEFFPQQRAFFTPAATPRPPAPSRGSPPQWSSCHCRWLVNPTRAASSSPACGRRTGARRSRRRRRSCRAARRLW